MPESPMTGAITDWTRPGDLDMIECFEIRVNLDIFDNTDCYNNYLYLDIKDENEIVVPSILSDSWKPFCQHLHLFARLPLSSPHASVTEN